MLSRTCDFFSFNCCSFKVSCAFGHARVREHNARKCALSPLDQVQKAKEGTGRVVLWRELGITVRRSVFCSCPFQTITWHNDPFLNLYILNFVFRNTVLPEFFHSRSVALWARHRPKVTPHSRFPNRFSRQISQKLAVTIVSARAATSTSLTIYTLGSAFVTSFLTFGILTRCLNHTHP
jgi:hypothetical protein